MAPREGRYSRRAPILSSASRSRAGDDAGHTMTAAPSFLMPEPNGGPADARRGKHPKAQVPTAPSSGTADTNTTPTPIFQELHNRQGERIDGTLNLSTAGPISGSVAPGAARVKQRALRW
ncbi:hypothetical protein BC834DRAFT_380015 [Gloeopeniophorella convolvens]|nr:hypothetical protein BC834DRAFT_380015 [Gloeopeniophorella convolvens]